MCLLLALALLQQPLIQESPNSPASRQSEHARHHDVMKIRIGLPDSHYDTLSPKPTRQQIKVIESSGKYVHCYSWMHNFCMVETPKSK